MAKPKAKEMVNLIKAINKTGLLAKIKTKGLDEEEMQTAIFDAVEEVDGNDELDKLPKEVVSWYEKNVPEPTEDELRESLEELDKKELEEYIKENNLKIKVTKKDDEESIIEKIIDSVSPKSDDDDDEDSEEEDSEDDETEEEDSEDDDSEDEEKEEDDDDEEESEEDTEDEEIDDDDTEEETEDDDDDTDDDEDDEPITKKGKKEKKMAKKEKKEKVAKKEKKIEKVKKERKENKVPGVIDACVNAVVKSKGKKVKVDSLIESISKARNGDVKENIVRSYLGLIAKIVNGFGIGEADKNVFNLK